MSITSIRNSLVELRKLAKLYQMQLVLDDEHRAFTLDRMQSVMREVEALEGIAPTAAADAPTLEAQDPDGSGQWSPCVALTDQASPVQLALGTCVEQLTFAQAAHTVRLLLSIGQVREELDDPCPPLRGG